MIATQTRFDKSGEKAFFEYGHPATNDCRTAGQRDADFTLERRADRFDNQRRGNPPLRKIIDLLKNAEFTVLRRENNLERSTLDGLRTVVLPTKGLQIGDDVRIAATYTRRSDLKTGAPESLGTWEFPLAVGLLDSRVTIADGLDVKWRTGARAPKPIISKSADAIEYRFVQSNLAKLEYPSFMRAVDKANDVQFTAYRDWSQVAAEALPLYEKSQKNSPARRADCRGGQDRRCQSGSSPPHACCASPRARSNALCRPAAWRRRLYPGQCR